VNHTEHTGMTCENLTAATMGGCFDECIAPHLRRRTGWRRRGGRVSMLHNDGALRGTLQATHSVQTVAPVRDAAAACAALRNDKNSNFSLVFDWERAG